VVGAGDTLVGGGSTPLALRYPRTYVSSIWNRAQGFAIPASGRAVADQGERMTEEGTLSIVRRGTVYQVRYASNNPYAPDRAPRACHDADTLRAFLHHLGTELENIEQASVAVQRGGLAVLRILLSFEQIQACFRPSSSRDMCTPTRYRHRLIPLPTLSKSG